jgi:hypothetical protein
MKDLRIKECTDTDESLLLLYPPRQSLYDLKEFSEGLFEI